MAKQQRARKGVTPQTHINDDDYSTLKTLLAGLNQESFLAIAELAHAMPIRELATKLGNRADTLAKLALRVSGRVRYISLAGGILPDTWSPEERLMLACENAGIDPWEVEGIRDEQLAQRVASELRSMRDRHKSKK